MKVFIGGSRRISRLSRDLRTRLDHIMAKGLSVVVGDANGADKAVQQYLADANYRQVEVFCVRGNCRNNWGEWPVREIEVDSSARGFAYYSAKDKVMADEAGIGLMIWDGRSRGTLSNVQRLVEQDKTTVVYFVPSKQFYNVRAASDLDALITRAKGEFDSEAYETSDRVRLLHSRSPAQPLLF